MVEERIEMLRKLLICLVCRLEGFNLYPFVYLTRFEILWKNLILLISLEHHFELMLKHLCLWFVNQVAGKHFHLSSRRLVSFSRETVLNECLSLMYVCCDVHTYKSCLEFEK
jgi:hypothetical protein